MIIPSELSTSLAIYKLMFDVYGILHEKSEGARTKAAPVLYSYILCYK